MFSWLIDLFKKDTRTEEEKEQDTILESLQNNTCPDCHGKGFYEGPSGGMCTNIQCANPKCKSEFNYCGVHAHRI